MIVAVPVIVKLLGVASFGLVGLYATVQAALAALDLGLGATINRESARLNAVHDTSAIRRMLVSFSWLYWGVALAIAALGLLVGPMIASHWIQSIDTVPRSDVRTAAIGIALALAAAWPGTCYRNALNGLEHQTLTAIAATGATLLRTIGAIAALQLAGPSIGVYFAVQIAANVLETAACAMMLRRVLPSNGTVVRFDRNELLARRNFAGAMAVFVALGLLLHQSDRLVLSRIAPLDAFGGYVVAWMAASMLIKLASPLVTAIAPRAAALVSVDRHDDSHDLLRITIALLSAVVAPAAVILAVFPRATLIVWGQTAEAIEHAAPVLSSLACAAMMIAWAQPILTLSFARGHVLSVAVVNGIALLVAIPTVTAGYMTDGLAGAALAMASACAAAFAGTALVVLRRERGALARIVLFDMVVPVAAACAIALAVRALIPMPASRGLLGLLLAASGVGAAGAAIVVAPRLRPFVLARQPR